MTKEQPLQDNWLDKHPSNVFRLKILPDESLQKIMALQEALYTRNKDAALFFESTPDALVITNELGQIVIINHQTEQLFGWTRQELIGQAVEVLMAGEDGTHHQKLREKYLQNTLPRMMGVGRPSLRARRKDGSDFPVHISLSPIKVEKELLVIASVRDITEYKQTQAQLLHIQKIESLGLLSSGIAHNFNNLMAIINGTVELLLEELEADHPLLPSLQVIQESGYQASELTKQLLAFSRKQTLKPIVVNLNSIILNLKGLLERLLRKDIELRFHLDEGLALIEVAPAQIEQVIINLAINSADAMPMGGILTLTTTNAVVRETSLHSHHLMPPGEYILLSVSDTGIGMDESSLEKIFEPFFTTKETSKGTGLGMATVHGIVKQSNGYIFVESVLDKGTTTYIYLPRTDKAMRSV